MNRDGLDYEIKIIHKASEIVLDEKFTSYLVLTNRNVYREQKDFVEEIVKKYSDFLLFS